MNIFVVLADLQFFGCLFQIKENRICFICIFVIFNFVCKTPEIGNNLHCCVMTSLNMKSEDLIC